MRRQRRTKIVATLGPASSDKAMITRLFEAGADVFRINMSHTSHTRMRELVGIIRAIEAEKARPIGILVDLQGPKLRLGTFADGAVVGSAIVGRIADTAGQPREAIVNAVLELTGALAASTHHAKVSA